MNMEKVKKIDMRAESREPAEEQQGCSREETRTNGAEISKPNKQI